jgi:hypothetical protein
MQIDQKDVAIKLVLIFIIVLTLGPLVTGCTSAAEKKEYRDAQVQVIDVQVNARAKENSADAAARIALYAAMAEVARTSPSSADAIAVAMAISSVKEESAPTAGIVQLRPEQNEALELAKAISPALIQTVGTVAVAGYQASVSKNNSDNAALVALGESGKDADIMRSVTSMGTTALGRQQGITVAGNYTEAGGNIDQSTNATQSTETTTTTTTTTSEQNNMSATESNNSYTTADGSNVSIEDIEALIANGIQVTVIIDGEEVVVEQCDDVLTFGGSC